MGKVLKLSRRDRVTIGPSITVDVLKVGREAVVCVTAPADVKIERVRGSAPPTLPFRPAMKTGPKGDLDPAA